MRHLERLKPLQATVGAPHAADFDVKIQTPCETASHSACWLFGTRLYWHCQTRLM